MKATSEKHEKERAPENWMMIQEAEWWGWSRLVGGWPLGKGSIPGLPRDKATGIWEALSVAVVAEAEEEELVATLSQEGHMVRVVAGGCM